MLCCENHIAIYARTRSWLRIVRCNCEAMQSPTLHNILIRYETRSCIRVEKGYNLLNHTI